jgi:hypothetical protein
VTDAESSSAGFAGDSADDLEKASDPFLLTHECRCAGGKCLTPRARIVLKRKDDYPCRRFGDGKPMSGPDAIEAVHAQVQDYHVRVELACKAYRRFAFRGLADDMEIRFAGHAHAQALADTGFIIDKKEADRAIHHAFNGRFRTCCRRHSRGRLLQEQLEGRNLVLKDEEGCADAR